ncbi:MAG: MoxR family ATPase [Jaaginema sp. PMC 1079.18]|nr:MoxR family ATPase [Jaaginema sp. PMC 1080.18]MEC4852321.1 MoxR family ATPase [Jaaginema sp. PMC 1079.18]MEC4865345.1 MoxR family ATPase [Jaaginema sp. PMC 1078.18]
MGVVKSQDHSIFDRLRQTLNKIIVGQPLVIEQLAIALLSGGHVIIEGVPGTGKTFLVKVFAQLIQADFRRVQLTPDILPSDIVGTNIFDFNNHSFTLQKGPVFTEILLADEINRTPPKTQAALLEAMAENQVTFDGETLPLPDLFWTVATQNPLEFEGTYPLPEAQLDRFLFKVVVDYPESPAEKQMLLNVQKGRYANHQKVSHFKPVMSVAQVLAARQGVQKVPVDEKVIDYLLDLVLRSRQHSDLALGASPRAAVAWLRASQALAWLRGEGNVTPDHVKEVAVPLLRHRLLLKPEAQLDGVAVEAAIASILDRVSVPRQ